MVKYEVAFGMEKASFREELDSLLMAIIEWFNTVP